MGSSHGLGRSEPAEPPGGGQGPGPSPLLSAEVVSELWLGTGHHSRCPVKMKCLTDGCHTASTSVHTCSPGLWPGSPCFWLSCPFAVFSQRCSPSPSGWGCWSWRSEQRPSGPKPLGLGRGHTRELGGAWRCRPQAPGCCLPSSLPSLASSSLRTWSTAYDECCRHPAVSSAPSAGRRGWLETRGQAGHLAPPWDLASPVQSGSRREAVWGWAEACWDQPGPRPPSQGVCVLHLAKHKLCGVQPHCPITGAFLTVTGAHLCPERLGE